MTRWFVGLFGRVGLFGLVGRVVVNTPCVCRGLSESELLGDGV